MNSIIENENDPEKNGSFYFNNQNVLCTGKIQLTEFVDYFLNHDDYNQNEIALDKNNEMIPYKTKMNTPLFIYSKKRLRFNYLNYKSSFDSEITEKCGNPTQISFSIKANYNPSVIKVFHEMNSWASLVNKNELLLALKLGFKGDNLIFNGNGKKLSEIELAIKSSCYLNIDSLFNLIHTIKVSKKLNESSQLDSGLKNFFPVKLVFRINQSLKAQVHQYLNTTGGSSKFGIQESQIDQMFELIKENKHLVKLAGFHVHLGSTIKALDIYDESVKDLVSLVNLTFKKHQNDLGSIEIINFGGGLGINYEKFADRTSLTTNNKQLNMPTPKDLARVIYQHIEKLEDKTIKIVVEPGRSLVGDSSILLTNLIGIKKNDDKNFMICDASMVECIRPCLYQAYHHIDYIKPLDEVSDKMLFDIVGPVCESGDFLGQKRFLPVPSNLDDTSSIFLAVMDVGAYCSSMSSNYNLHSRPAEVFIDEVEDDNENSSKAKYILTRKPDTLDNILGYFIDYN